MSESRFDYDVWRHRRPIHHVPPHPSPFFSHPLDHRDGQRFYAAVWRLGLLAAATAAWGSDRHLGQIVAFAGPRCPKGFLPADGRVMKFDQAQWLYSLLGNSYGGEQFRTLALPDLRRRTPVGSDFGQWDTVDRYSVGKTRGGETAVPAGESATGTTVAIPPSLAVTYCVAVDDRVVYPKPP